MKLLKHLFTSKPKKTGTIHSHKPQSFAQKRIESRNNSLQKAQEYRKELIKKEYVSAEPLKSEFQRKGIQTDLQIRKLKKSK